MKLRLILTVILFVELILPLFVTIASSEYTTPIVWSNKKEYDPSETAYLYGYGFKPSTQVTITIVRPDLVEDIVQTSTDEFGYFHCQYLLDGVHGVFNVTATDGINVATTTFENWLHLKAWWNSHDSIYIYSRAGGLSKYKNYYIKYFDPAGTERRQSPTYTGVHSFKDNLTILPTFPNIFGWWTVKLYENDAQKRTEMVYIDRIVWTTDSTYTMLVTSFAQGETVYFKTMGLQPTKYYRFKLEMPNGTRFYVGDWTTGVNTMTGSYPLPSTAPLGTWKLHVREAYDAVGTGEHHYVDCRFEVTTPPPPQQYYLTVRTNPLGIGTIPGEGWYNACTLVNLTAPELFPASTGIRYRFDYWDVDGVSQGIGVYEITVHMDTNHTATAHYITQYHLNLTTSPPGVTTPAGVGWYDAGTNASIFAPEFISIIPGASRYRFNGWTTADMPEIADPSATSTTVLMDKAKTVTANYVTQYLVTFNQTGLDSSASGTIVTVNGTSKTLSELPYSFWVDNGTGVTYSYSNTVSSSVSGKRFCLVDISGPTSPITITGPVTVTGNYKTQYFLTVTSPYGTPGGQGWYDSGDKAYATLDTGIVDHGNGTRRIFTHWSGNASGTNYAQSDPIIMDAPKTAIANWKTQHLVTFNQTGLDNTATGTVVTVNDTQLNYAQLPFPIWVNESSWISYTYNDVVPSTVSGRRFKLASITGPSSPFHVTEPTTVSGDYKTQYQITVTASPSGALGGTFKVTYTQCGTTYTNVQKTTPWSEWVDANTTVTVSEPQDPVNGYEFNSYNPSSSLTMDSAKTITLVYAEIPPLSVSISPTTVNIKIGESVTFTSTVSEGTPPYSYQWYLNGSAVSGAVSPTWTFTPTSTGTYTVYLNVTDSVPQTVKSNVASVIVAPPLSVSISPTSASILVGQSVSFTSTASGGYTPYSYQWYLNDAPVSGATSSSWTFTPTQSGIYYVHLKVTDDNGNVAQSETARITVASVPVGGYSISLAKRTPISQITVYTMLVALFGAALSLIKRKRK